MTAKVTYLGNLRTEAEHLQSSTKIITDAPVDNHGLGESFSPTDAVATALATCMLTIMGIKAEAMDISIKGATAEVIKTMASEPRRISKIEVKLTLESDLEDKDRKILQNAAKTCPVFYSLHPDIEKDIQFIYA
ncbi:OsmC family protein [Zunongwangia endophytica]|uniref:OsmC family protein n=1 Tax=Zunongwangia endophytica TaxID=1808945 RepID=A0ABV8H6P4_9FLAO|nr:OsmC family protein [Zunongwangia endophytica]MDN3594781.1 OsmC family protein [Zunongwangia endophytica]